MHLFSSFYSIQAFKYLHVIALENNDILLPKGSITYATDTLLLFKLATKYKYKTASHDWIIFEGAMPLQKDYWRGSCLFCPLAQPPLEL